MRREEVKPASSSSRMTALGRLVLIIVFSLGMAPAFTKEATPPHPSPVSQLIAACKHGDLEQVKNLLASGVNVNQSTVNQPTPLLAACYGGSDRICQILLQKGAATNVFDSNGMSPLLYCSYEGEYAIANLLLLYDADPNQRSPGGATPLQAAAQEGRNRVVDLLLVHSANIDSQDNWGETPLMLAAEGGRLKTVSILLNHGAKVYIKDGDGKTALDYARKSGDKAVIAAIEMARKAHKNKPTPFDQPIHSATAKQFIKELEALTTKLPEKQAAGLKAAIHSDLADFDAHISKRIEKEKTASRISGPLSEKQKRILTGVAQQQELFSRTGKLPSDYGVKVPRRPADMKPLDPATIKYALFNGLSPREIIDQARR
ncbi:MAG: ankyrin repeat domain-containing protein [Acidobacteriota bacterium]|jgi:ankyrin repeat protein